MTHEVVRSTVLRAEGTVERHVPMINGLLQPNRTYLELA